MKTVLSKETLQVFWHCTRYSTYFCNQCCDFSEKIIKLLNERSDNYWFCPSCTKSALHAVFVEKDIEDRYQIFFETIESRIKKIEEDNTSICSSLEIVMKNTEDRNITVRNELDKLEDGSFPVKNKFLINNPQQMTQMKTRCLIQSRPVRTLRSL